MGTTFHNQLIMTAIPTSQQLLRTAQILGEIEPETKEQARALTDTVRFLTSLARAPEAAAVLGEQMTHACLELGQSARERTIAVIEQRLRTASNQVMNQFDQSLGSPALRQAYLEFAQATRVAMAMDGINPLDGIQEREEHSKRRIDAFNAAEATVAGVRAALRKPMNCWAGRNALNTLAEEYMDMGRSRRAYLEHLEDAIQALEGFNPQDKVTAKTRGMRR